MISFEEKLKDALKPLYRKMFEENTFEDICAFCVQWGKEFPMAENTGILFVGKAVNSWKTDETDVDILFGDSEESIFARKDQMKWVKDSEGSEEYNTKKSAFWRVIKQVSLNYFPEEWYSKVAWSNLCKLAPFYKGGNPSNGLYYEQLDSCLNILQKEIEILSPQVVVMLTSGWEKDFLLFLNGNNQPKSEQTIEWYGYETNLYNIKGVKYIVSQHPQGKGEDKHIEAIIKLIGNLK